VHCQSLGFFAASLPRQARTWSVSIDERENSFEELIECAWNHVDDEVTSVLPYPFYRMFLESV
jgi:hypothetical protein